MTNKINKNTQEEYEFSDYDMNSLFKIFTALTNHPLISLKIKLLIKNLLERREKGWVNFF